MNWDDTPRKVLLSSTAYPGAFIPYKDGGSLGIGINGV
jgi:hypothetical protein